LLVIPFILLSQEIIIMHIHEVMAAADYRMVEGRDWIWDFLGKNCREILFESWGPHDSSEHFPVSATFSANDGAVKQLTVETDSGFYRWIDLSCHPGYMLACKDLGEKPWAEPGLIWIHDAAVPVTQMKAIAGKPVRLRWTVCRSPTVTYASIPDALGLCFLPAESCLDALAGSA